MPIVKQVLKSILLDFSYDYYKNQIIKIRENIEKKPYYKDNWDKVIELIIYRRLKEGEALSLIQNDANLPLYYNTDEEAYRWLDLMLINSLGKGEVIPYQDIG